MNRDYYSIIHEMALAAIRHRAVYDINRQAFVFVNRLIYWDIDLVILGYAEHYYAEDYGVTWTLTKDKE